MGTHRPSYLGGSGSHETRRPSRMNPSADAKEPAGGKRTRPLCVGKRDVQSTRKWCQNGKNLRLYGVHSALAGVGAAEKGARRQNLPLMYIYLYSTPHCCPELPSDRHFGAPVLDRCECARGPRDELLFSPNRASGTGNRTRNSSLLARCLFTLSPLYRKEDAAEGSEVIAIRRRLTARWLSKRPRLLHLQRTCAVF